MLDKWQYVIYISSISTKEPLMSGEKYMGQIGLFDRENRLTELSEMGPS
jgi:hypothetical protein